jgi:hypothetical protein
MLMCGVSSAASVRRGARGMNGQQGYANASPDTVVLGMRKRASRSLSERSTTAFLAVVGVIAALRLLALAFNRTDLYMDEAQYWAWSLEPAHGNY